MKKRTLFLLLFPYLAFLFIGTAVIGYTMFAESGPLVQEAGRGYYFLGLEIVIFSVFTLLFYRKLNLIIDQVKLNLGTATGLVEPVKSAENLADIADYTLFPGDFSDLMNKVKAVFFDTCFASTTVVRTFPIFHPFS